MFILAIKTYVKEKRQIFNTTVNILIALTFLKSFQASGCSGFCSVVSRWRCFAGVLGWPGGLLCAAFWALVSVYDDSQIFDDWMHRAASSTAAQIGYLGRWGDRAAWSKVCPIFQFSLFVGGKWS